MVSKLDFWYAGFMSLERGLFPMEWGTGDFPSK